MLKHWSKGKPPTVGTPELTQNISLPSCLPPFFKKKSFIQILRLLDSSVGDLENFLKRKKTTTSKREHGWLEEQMHNVELNRTKLIRESQLV